MSTSKIKWGIIGLGNIAHQFAKDLALIHDAELYAVASRNIDKANKFSRSYKAKVAYGNYQELITSNNVDIVYIATPHDSHKNLAIEALNNNKHVLCEKPLAINHQQVSQMVKTSKRNNTFLMEAFWTRFNPSIREILLKVKQGELGDVNYINADFAFHIPHIGGRMTNINNAGGSLLDMGVYPIFLSYLILGIPYKVLASANFFESGADKQTSAILHYKNAQAVLHSSFVSSSNMVATISGNLGRININSIWHETQSYSLIKNNHKVDFNFPTLGKGFTYEINECHKCIRNNQIESNIWSHKNSLELVSIVDEVRKQTGLKFPNEK